MFNVFRPLNVFYNWYRNALRHPKSRWWVLGATVLWLVNPLNAIPIVGEIDDAIVLGIVVTEVSQIVLENIKNKKSIQENSIV
ncbi:MAG: hypothetical protein WCO81_08945 [Cyanobacteriota bacterium ELA615]|jgi:uncharacterized membrane protein YkvA (DUF1232 family)